MPRRCTQSASPSTARAIKHHSPDRPSDSLPPKSATGVQIPTNDLWDPWPDQDFERLFTWEEETKANNFSEHWACQPGGGDRRGSESALTWSQGKKTRHICLGVITCDKPTCEVITCLQTRRAGITGQLNASCLCSGQLTHVDCGVMSVLYSFKGGLYYIHKGVHQHPKQTHILHLSCDKQVRFE